MLLILGNDMIEIGDDCAENSEPPKVLLPRAGAELPTARNGDNLIGTCRKLAGNVLNE